MLAHLLKLTTKVEGSGQDELEFGMVEGEEDVGTKKYYRKQFNHSCREAYFNMPLFTLSTWITFISRLHSLRLSRYSQPLRDLVCDLRIVALVFTLLVADGDGFSIAMCHTLNLTTSTFETT